MTLETKFFCTNQIFLCKQAGRKPEYNMGRVQKYAPCPRLLCLFFIGNYCFLQRISASHPSSAAPGLCPVLSIGSRKTSPAESAMEPLSAGYPVLHPSSNHHTNSAIRVIPT